MKQISDFDTEKMILLLLNFHKLFNFGNLKELFSFTASSLSLRIKFIMYNIFFNCLLGNNLWYFLIVRTADRQHR